MTKRRFHFLIFRFFAINSKQNRYTFLYDKNKCNNRIKGFENYSDQKTYQRTECRFECVVFVSLVNLSQISSQERAEYYPQNAERSYAYAKKGSKNIPTSKPMVLPLTPYLLPPVFFVP